VLHAHERLADARIALRIARRDPDHVAGVQVNFVRVQARATELNLIEQAATSGVQRENDYDNGTHRFLLVSIGLPESPMSGFYIDLELHKALTVPTVYCLVFRDVAHVFAVAAHCGEAREMKRGAVAVHAGWH
jgi:hypothetical protein